MKLSTNLERFKKLHKKKFNQTIHFSLRCNNYKFIENLYKFILVKKNSFIFESVEKGKIRGRYTIFGKNPDKIWEFNNKNSYIIQNNKKIKLKGKPYKLIENIIEDFKFETPNNLPNIC